MHTVRLHSQAMEEALAAATWYEGRRTGLGNDFLAELDRACSVLGQSPLVWPLWPGVARRMRIRRFLLSRFPFGIAFEATDDEVVVYAIAHLGRKPGYWRERLKP